MPKKTILSKPVNISTDTKVLHRMNLKEESPPHIKAVYSQPERIRKAKKKKVHVINVIKGGLFVEKKNLEKK